MRFIVCYDIADDRRRDRMAVMLLNFGRRVQESVFVADLDTERASAMGQEIRKIVEAVEDCVHVFPLCSACWSKAEVVGLGELPADSEFYVL